MGDCHAGFLGEGRKTFTRSRWWTAFLERNSEGIIRAGLYGAFDVADTLGLCRSYWQTGTWRSAKQPYAVSAVDWVDARVSLIMLQRFIFNRVDGCIVRTIRPTRPGYTHLHPAVDSIYAADIEGLLTFSYVQGKLANICTFLSQMEVGSCYRTLRCNEKSNIAGETFPLRIELLGCAGSQREFPLQWVSRNR